MSTNINMALLRGGSLKALSKQCRYTNYFVHGDNMSKYAARMKAAKGNPGMLHRMTSGKMDLENRWMKNRGIDMEKRRGGLSKFQQESKKELTPHFVTDAGGNRTMINKDEVHRARLRQTASNAFRKLDELNGVENYSWKPGNVNWSKSRNNSKKNRVYVMNDDDIEDSHKRYTADTDAIDRSPRGNKTQRSFKSALVREPTQEFDCGTWLDNLEAEGQLEPLERQFAMEPEHRVYRFAENTRDYDNSALQMMAKRDQSRESIRRIKNYPEELRPAPIELEPTRFNTIDRLKYGKNLKHKDYWKQRSFSHPDNYGGNEAHRKSNSNSMGYKDF